MKEFSYKKFSNIILNRLMLDFKKYENHKFK